LRAVLRTAFAVFLVAFRPRAAARAGRRFGADRRAGVAAFRDPAFFFAPRFLLMVVSSQV
jgi:hypothetical protein